MIFILKMRSYKRLMRSHTARMQFIFTNSFNSPIQQVILFNNSVMHFCDSTQKRLKRYNPSVTALPCHLPLHKGGFLLSVTTLRLHLFIIFQRFLLILYKSTRLIARFFVTQLYLQRLFSMISYKQKTNKKGLLK